MVTATRAAELL